MNSSCGLVLLLLVAMLTGCCCSPHWHRLVLLERSGTAMSLMGIQDSVSIGEIGCFMGRLQSLTFFAPDADTAGGRHQTAALKKSGFVFARRILRVLPMHMGVERSYHFRLSDRKFTAIS